MHKNNVLKIQSNNDKQILFVSAEVHGDVDRDKAAKEYGLSRGIFNQVVGIASLHFSSMDIGLKQRDLFRFMMQYLGKQLRGVLETQMSFWQKVGKRVIKIYRAHGYSAHRVYKLCI